MGLHPGTPARAGGRRPTAEPSRCPVCIIFDTVMWVCQNSAPSCQWIFRSFTIFPSEVLKERDNLCKRHLFLLSEVFFLIYLKILFIYSYKTERGAETQAEGEAGSSRELDVGLDPGTLGSRPGSKAGAQPLRHPGIPQSEVFKNLSPDKIARPTKPGQSQVSRAGCHRGLRRGPGAGGTTGLPQPPAVRCQRSSWLHLGVVLQRNRRGQVGPEWHPPPVRGSLSPRALGLRPPLCGAVVTGRLLLWRRQTCPPEGPSPLFGASAQGVHLELPRDRGPCARERAACPLGWAWPLRLPALSQWGCRQGAFCWSVDSRLGFPPHSSIPRSLM